MIWERETVPALDAEACPASEQVVIDVARIGREPNGKVGGIGLLDERREVVYREAGKTIEIRWLASFLSLGLLVLPLRIGPLQSRANLSRACNTCRRGAWGRR